MDPSTVPQRPSARLALPQPDNRSLSTPRTAVGYVRVSTPMQADGGLSLVAQ